MVKPINRQQQQNLKAQRCHQSKCVSHAKLIADAERLEVAIADSQVAYIQELLQEWETAP